jgi:hypothetical protein
MRIANLHDHTACLRAVRCSPLANGRDALDRGRRGAAFRVPIGAHRRTQGHGRLIRPTERPIKRDERLIKPAEPPFSPIEPPIKREEAPIKPKGAAFQP